MNRKFLYYLLKKDGRSGQVVNDVVTYSGQPKPLPQTPSGWQELIILFERSLDKHGLLTMSSLPFGFVRNGARIIRDALYKETIEAEIFLLIQRLELELTVSTYNWVYKYLIKGELDLSKADDSRDMISVPIMEIGLTKLLKANEKTVYEFPMNDPVCVNLKHDGIELDQKGNFALVDSFVIDNTLYGDSSWAPFSNLNNEGTLQRIAFFSQSIENTAGVAFADRLTSPNFFAQAALNNLISVDVHITGKIVYHCTEQDAANGFRMRFLRSGQNVGNQNDYDLFIDTPLVQGETYSHDIDITIPLAPGERLYLEMILGNTGVDTKISFDADSKLSADFVFRSPATYIKCYRRFDLFKKLCGKVFNDENVAVSTLLETEEINNVLITCGDAIRGLENATLKTSLDDFWRDCDSTFMCGQMIVGDTFEIEDRIKYYTESAVIDEVDLGFVTDLKINPASDLMCNTYKFGHQKQDIEDVNGKYDPNGTNAFTGPITKVVKEYNMVSPYKAGPYEIEMLRINLDGKTTTDDNSDNDVFVIASLPQADLETEVSFLNVLSGMIVSNPERFQVGQKIRITGSASNDGVYDIFSINFLLAFSVIVFSQPVVDEASVTINIEWLTGDVYTLNRPAYTLEGVPHDSIYNLPYLTPMAMLLRHIRWIAGINYGLASKKIKFANGKDNKNTELKTVLAGVTIDEDKDESFAGVTPMFIPFYGAFKTEVPINLPERLETDPNRSFKYLDEYDQEWKIFLRMGGIAPNDYTPQEYKGLLTPNNNIELLIHG